MTGKMHATVLDIEITTKYYTRIITNSFLIYLLEKMGRLQTLFLFITDICLWMITWCYAFIPPNLTSLFSITLSIIIKRQEREAQTGLFSALLSATDGSPDPLCNLCCLKCCKIPMALQLLSLACQDSSISNSVTWCLELRQRLAYAPNDSQQRGHWRGQIWFAIPLIRLGEQGFYFLQS